LRELSYILPTAAILFVVFLFVEYLRLRREVPADETVRFARTDHFGRSDLLIILLLCAVYAGAAFCALGDIKAPESFCLFPERGRYTVVEFAGPQEISRLSWFAGHAPGECYVSFSDDGTLWSEGILMDQDVPAVLKWHDVELPEGGVTARFLRLVAGTGIQIGELAIRDGDGQLLAPPDFEYAEGALRLFDEQDCVPESATWMNSSYFDEIYHVRTANEHILHEKPYEITHPPLGKIILGLGIRLFGLTPFGWRFSGTMIGVLMLPVFYVFLMLLFRRRAVAVCGTLLFAFDFMHFVQTRIATIDSYAVFFILLMYLFMYMYITAPRDEPLAPAWRRVLPLFLSGLSFGLGAASKWTCLYAGAGLAVIWFLFWGLRGRELIAAGQARRWRREFLSGVGQCLVFFVAIPLTVYYVSYWPYGRAEGLSGLSMLFSGEYADIVWRNQVYMWEYHSDLVAEHPYASRWYQWILDIRPILYYMKNSADGLQTSRFGAFTNPLLCWLGLPAMLHVAWRGLFRGDETARFIFLGYLAQLLPWIPVSRLTFAYHYFPSMIFLTMAVCYIFVFMWDNRKRWPMYSFTAASLGLFAVFWPALTGTTVSSWYSSTILQWLPSWPF